MIPYKNTKATLCSSNEDTDFFNNLTGVLQESTSSPFLSIICLHYVQQTWIDLMKENGFTRKSQEVDNIP